MAAASSASLARHSNARSLRCSFELGYPLHDGVPTLVVDQAVARPIHTDTAFEALLAEAASAPFSGWNWSWIHDWQRVVHTPRDLAPVYAARARVRVSGADTVLDLGPGGGEQFAG